MMLVHFEPFCVIFIVSYLLKREKMRKILKMRELCMMLVHFEPFCVIFIKKGKDEKDIEDEGTVYDACAF